PSGLNPASTLWSFPAINAAGGDFHAKIGAPEYARVAAAVIFMFYAALRTHVFVGVGNRLKGDDAFGPLAADGFRAAGFTSMDAGDAPENMANKILASNPEVIIVFDALSSLDDRAGFFGLYAPDETSRSAHMSTHGGGIGMFLEYLKMNSRARIAVVGASGESFSLGSEVSPPVATAVRDISDCAVRIKKCTS
ncbi:MAG: hydrogenase maturation protease, partial [Endomicrobiia bacterium]|nr:hydrogenase maturation protease [Endomicrobiia bacterium]